MLTDEELKAARALVEAATPGEWNVQEWRHWADPSKRNFTVQYTATDRFNEGAKFALATVELYGYSETGSTEANAAFIAASRTLVPKLLDEVERLQACLKGYRPFAMRAADVLADEADVLVHRKVVDTRSPLADALLDYRNSPSTERSTRLAVLETEVERLRAENADLFNRLSLSLEDRPHAGDPHEGTR